MKSGKAAFSVADASSYSLPEKIGFATCMFDAMNHLPSNEAIGRCIQITYDTLQSKGLFVFDINTRQSLSRWNKVSITEDDELFMLTRGIFDESMDRTYTQISGFVKEADGRYLSFSQTAYNLALEAEEMLSIAKNVGFAKIYCAAQRT